MNTQHLTQTSRLLGLSLLALTALPPTAAANLNLFDNGSFETLTPYIEFLLEDSDSAELPVSDPYDPGTSYLPSWSNSEETYIYEQWGKADPILPTDGNNFLYLGAGYNDFGAGVSGSINQTLNLSAGSTYLFTFDQYVWEQTHPFATYKQDFRFSFEGENLYWGQYIQTSTGAVEDTRAGTSPSDNLNHYFVDIPDPGWIQRSFEFTPTVGGEFDFNFRIVAGGDRFQYPRQRMTIDNLSLTVVPEPKTYAALLGAGVLGFVFWRRRSRWQRTIKE